MEIIGILPIPAPDILFFFFGSAIFFLTALLAGGSRIHYVLFSAYIVFLAYPLVPYRNAWKMLQPRERVATELFILTASIIIIAVILMRFRIMSQTKERWWGSFLLSLLVTGFFFSGVLYLIVPGDLIPLSHFSETFFNSPGAFFVWIFMPLLGILFFERRGRET